MPTSIIIAHPYRIFRQGLHTLLETSSEIRVVGEAESGQEALALVHATKPNIALIDSALENPDCARTTQSINAGRASHAGDRAEH